MDQEGVTLEMPVTRVNPKQHPLDTASPERDAMSVSANAGGEQDLVKIPFHGSEVLAVEIDGKPHVILRPVIESLGLDYSAQYRKLNRRSWASVVSKTMQLPGDTQSREMVAIPVRTLTMLLATVDENRVNEAARPLLIAYQSEVADVIEAYFTQGGAINPRATEDQLGKIIILAEGQARVLRTLSGVCDPAWLEAKGRHVAARALGEEPELDATKRPLSVGE